MFEDLNPQLTPKEGEAAEAGRLGTTMKTALRKTYEKQSLIPCLSTTPHIITQPGRGSS